MLAAADWLAGLLEDLFNTVQLPLFALIPDGALPLLTNLAAALALAMTVALRVVRRLVPAPGLLCQPREAESFRRHLRRDLPGLHAESLDHAVGRRAGGFKVGFAALGIVHMTQYLAIVWRYNRSLAAHPQRSRQAGFRRLHARGRLAHRRRLRDLLPVVRRSAGPAPMAAAG